MGCLDSHLVLCAALVWGSSGVLGVYCISCPVFSLCRCSKTGTRSLWRWVHLSRNLRNSQRGKLLQEAHSTQNIHICPYINIHIFSLQLSFSPSTPMNNHVRVICLLVSLLLDCCGLAVVCGLLGASYGMHTLSFMAAEVRTFLPIRSTDDWEAGQFRSGQQAGRPI